jgi:hypothetical protein
MYDVASASVLPLVQHKAKAKGPGNSQHRIPASRINGFNTVLSTLKVVLKFGLEMRSLYIFVYLYVANCTRISGRC